MSVGGAVCKAVSVGGAVCKAVRCACECRRCSLQGCEVCV